MITENNGSSVFPSLRCSIADEFEEGDLSKHMIYSQMKTKDTSDNGRGSDQLSRKISTAYYSPV